MNKVEMPKYMTVKDLKQMLMNFDDDAPVYCQVNYEPAYQQIKQLCGPVPKFYTPAGWMQDGINPHGFMICAHHYGAWETEHSGAK